MHTKEQISRRFLSYDNEHNYHYRLLCPHAHPSATSWVAKVFFSFALFDLITLSLEWLAALTPWHCQLFHHIIHTLVIIKLTQWRPFVIVGEAALFPHTSPNNNVVKCKKIIKYFALTSGIEIHISSSVNYNFIWLGCLPAWPIQLWSLVYFMHNHNCI